MTGGTPLDSCEVRSASSRDTKAQGEYEPCASTTSTRKGDTGYRLYQGGFTCALRSSDGDHGEVDVDLDARNEMAENVKNRKRGIKTNSYRPCQVERVDDV